MVVGILLLVWNMVGFAIHIAIAMSDSKLSSCLLWDYLNPLWLYKEYRLNWFGIFLFSLLLNLLCPVLTLILWFCKLCTVGRK